MPVSGQDGVNFNNFTAPIVVPRGPVYVSGQGAPSTDTHLRLTGVTGDEATTPASAALDALVNQNFTVYVRVMLDDWTPTSGQALIGPYTSTANGTWRFFVATGGFPSIASTSNGTSSSTGSSTVTVPVVDGTTVWLRAVIVSASAQASFSWAPDEPNVPTTWITLSSNRAISAAPLWTSTAPVEVGGALGGTSSPLSGRIYRARVVDATAAPVIDFNPLDWPGSSPWTSSATGEVWTLVGGATVVPVQTTPVDPPWVTGRRMVRMLAVRRGRTASPVLTQTTPVSPVFVPRPAAIARRLLARRRPTSTTAVPAQTLPVNPMFMPRPVTVARRALPHRHSTATPIPEQTVPMVSAQSARRLLPPRRRRSVVVTPAQTTPVAPAFVPQNQRRVTRGWMVRRRSSQHIPGQTHPPVPQSRTRRSTLLPRRGRSTLVVPVQTSPVNPVWVPRPVAIARRLLARRRSASVSPIPVQTTPVAPAFVPQSQSRSRRGLMLRRRSSTAPIPTQTVPVAPVFVARPRSRARLGFMVRRRTSTTAVPAQATPIAPIFSSRRTTPRLTVRRRPTQQHIAGQSHPPIPQTRTVRRVPMLRRGRSVNPPVPQATPPVVRPLSLIPARVRRILRRVRRLFQPPFPSQAAPTVITGPLQTTSLTPSRLTVSLVEDRASVSLTTRRATVSAKQPRDTDPLSPRRDTEAIR